MNTQSWRLDVGCGHWSCRTVCVDLTDDVPVLVDEIPTGRTYLDGSRLIGAMDGIVRGPYPYGGLAGMSFVTVIMDEADEVLGDPWAERVAGLRPVAKGGQGG